MLQHLLPKNFPNFIFHKKMCFLVEKEFARQRLYESILGSLDEILPEFSGKQNQHLLLRYIFVLKAFPQKSHGDEHPVFILQNANSEKAIRAQLTEDLFYMMPKSKLPGDIHALVRY